MNPAWAWRARASGIRAGQVGSCLLLGLVVALALLRFWDLQSAPFISDEPAFQMIIDYHLAQHTLPTHALWGTKGVVYGPTALWLYMPLRLFTDSVVWIVGFHAFFHGLGFLLLFLTLRSSLGSSVARWTLLLVVASPYLFFYARLPWDNTFLVFLVPLTLFFLVRLTDDPSRIGSWVGLGLACGLVFDLHLMALPVIVAAWLVALPCLWRTRGVWRAWVGLAAALLCMLGTTAPYVRELARTPSGYPVALTKDGLTYTLRETFFGTGAFLSSEGMDYFLDQTIAPVRASLGTLYRANVLAWAVRLAGWGALIWSLLRLLSSLFRKRNGERPSCLPAVLRYAVIYFVLLLLYYAAVRPFPFHPHYFMSAFFIVPVFAAWSMNRLPWPLGRGLQTVTLALVVANLAFVVTAHSEIARNQGTRGEHYSTIPSEIRARTQEICRRARQDSKTRVAVALYEVPAVQDRQFEWFKSHLPECAGIAFAFPSSDGARADDTLRVRVTYRSSSPYDARLAIVETP